MRNNKILVLLLIFSHLTLLAQELKCCESVAEAERYLNGNWKKKTQTLIHYININLTIKRENLRFSQSIMTGLWN